MLPGRWSELSAKHEVTYTGIGKFIVITMPRAFGQTRGLYRLVVGEAGPKIKHEFLSK
jgi:hypothetical protein